MPELKLIEGPKLARVRCLMCAGTGLVALTVTRLPRRCPHCEGAGVAVDDNRRHGIDLAAYALNLHPRTHQGEGTGHE